MAQQSGVWHQVPCLQGLPQRRAPPEPTLEAPRRLSEHSCQAGNLTGQPCPSDQDKFTSVGARPWLAESAGPCGQPIRGALRGAGNVHFPKVESSIYLPRDEGRVSDELHELVRRPDVSTVLHLLHSLLGNAVTVGQLRERVEPELFQRLSDAELMAAFRDTCGIGEQAAAGADDDATAETLTGNAEWRYPEYLRIRETPGNPDLTATDPASTTTCGATSAGSGE